MGDCIHIKEEEFDGRQRGNRSCQQFKVSSLSSPGTSQGHVPRRSHSWEVDPGRSHCRVGIQKLGWREQEGKSCHSTGPGCNGYMVYLTLGGGLRSGSVAPKRCLSSGMASLATVAADPRHGPGGSAVRWGD